MTALVAQLLVLGRTFCEGVTAQDTELVVHYASTVMYSSIGGQTQMRLRSP